LLLVSLEDVDVRLWGAAILSGVTFELRESQSWAILGGNGAGKTTLLRLLRGDVWPHPESRGRRLYHFGAGAASVDPSESPIGARERMALVSAEAQDAYQRRGWDVRVEDVVRTGFAGGIWVTEPVTDEQEQRVDEVIDLLGIGPLRRQSILEVSTGEARKALLARALAPRPRVLLLDEFCNGLDAPSRAALLGVVSDIARRGTPIVFATHRLDEIVPEVTHAAILEGGRIVERGARAEVLPRWDSPFRPTSSWTQAATTTPTANANDGFLIAIENTDVLIEGHRVLRGIRWRMRHDENWVVRGRNGAGKSTFLRLLAGEEHAASGGRIVRLDLGEHPGLFEVRGRIALVGPKLQADHRLEATGEAVVLSGFFGSIGLPSEPTPAQRAAARRWLQRLGIEALAARGIQELSYGELRRLLLARALVIDPDVVLLDEPFNGLDPRGRVEMMGLLGDLCRSGTRIVLVTHHDGEVIPAVNREMELAGGKIAYQGPLR
jgi:molybdate transport system ATP-binding protein